MRKISLLFLLMIFTANAQASNSCCGKGRCSKTHYCDTSAGRGVCSNGNYSQCYCQKTAVMDLQNVSACCTWRGGVLTVKNGTVICNDGSVSLICSTINDIMKHGWQ